MRHYGFLTSIVLLMVCSAASAQAPAPVKQQDRARWIQEIRTYKHDFIAKELSLTKEQQRKFFPVYDQMEDEIERINMETRELESKADQPDASELELENAARTIFEQKRAEGQIEMTYFEKFKEILTPQQLIKMKNAERRFTQNLVNSHRRTRPRHSNNTN
ncbi:MAG: hypothetical protein K2M19_06875 [Muribaculaceae bacterium]|nr:hypothetical protein [Muribaculaceae bacterium]